MHVNDVLPSPGISCKTVHTIMKLDSHKPNSINSLKEISSPIFQNFQHHNWHPVAPFTNMV